MDALPPRSPALATVLGQCSCFRPGGWGGSSYGLSWASGPWWDHQWLWHHPIHEDCKQSLCSHDPSVSRMSKGKLEGSHNQYPLTFNLGIHGGEENTLFLQNKQTIYLQFRTRVLNLLIPDMLIVLCHGFVLRCQQHAPPSCNNQMSPDIAKFLKGETAPVENHWFRTLKHLWH